MPEARYWMLDTGCWMVRDSNRQF